jgi:pimeloyl-ACP methyl ester carboxylesterase
MSQSTVIAFPQAQANVVAFPVSVYPAVRRRTRVGNAILAVLVVALGTIGLVLARPMALYDLSTRAHLWVAGINDTYAQVDGHQIHYFVGGPGTGETIVLIHGVGGRAQDWSEMMPQFVRAGYQVYAIDLLGFGKSDRPANATYTVAQQTRIVEDFVAQKHMQRVNLMGWSLGGWIAARIALEQPQIVDRLVLYDSAGIRYGMGIGPDTFQPDTPKKLETLYGLLMPDPVHFPAVVAHDLLRRIQQSPWVMERSVRSMLTGKDTLDGKLQDIRIPTLIVWGKQDHLIPVASGEKLHDQIHQSVLEIFDGCGHLAPGQCAGTVGPETIQFLKSQPGMQARTVQVPAAE